MPARTYSFIEPAFGIIVASSEKLMLWKYIVMRPIASAARKTQLAAKPCPTEIEHPAGDDEAERRADRGRKPDGPPLEPDTGRLRCHLPSPPRWRPQV